MAVGSIEVQVDCWALGFVAGPAAAGGDPVKHKPEGRALAPVADTGLDPVAIIVEVVSGVPAPPLDERWVLVKGAVGWSDSREPDR